MKKWFFLNRIYMYGTRIPIGNGINFSAAHNTIAAKTDVAVVHEQAALRAFFTLQPVGGFCIEERFPGESPDIPGR